MSDRLRVEVVLALPQRCWRCTVETVAGATAGEVLCRSGLAAVCEREAGESPELGVFGRRVGADHVLQPGERLELYRGLTANPRQRRRLRASARRNAREG